jgi:carboxyl-terminal processing protease
MRRAVGGAAALLVGGAIALIGLAAVGSTGPSEGEAREPRSGLEETASLGRPLGAPREPVSPEELLRREVARELTRTFYRPVPGDVLSLATIEEMVESLGDPYTDHLTPDEYQSLRNRTARSYAGVGLTVGQAREGLIVTSALPGPARDAGIRKGDVIVRIDGQPARSLTFERSLALIKGEQGTLVRLTVRRETEGVIQFTVVRREIATPSVRSRLIRYRKAKLAYVRLLSFPGNAASRVEEAAAALVAKGAQGLILDLRDNPGGLLREAVRVVSLFVENGVVCAIEGEHQPERVYRVTGLASFPRLPIVVLVNGGSASAAEIVAAALRDHGRAAVVGDRTYGKASVQALVALSDGSALRVTTATYRTPGGATLLGRGLDPVRVVVDDPLTEPDEAVVVAEAALVAQLDISRGLSR